MSVTTDRIVSEQTVLFNDLALKNDDLSYYFKMARVNKYGPTTRRALRRHMLTHEEDRLLGYIMEFKQTEIGRNIRSAKSYRKIMTEDMKNKIRKAIDSRIKLLEESTHG